MYTVYRVLCIVDNGFSVQTTVERATIETKTKTAQH